MDLSFIAVQVLTGLAAASSLFIMACGLTIVFGVTRIVNFAHGSLYMLGAYFAVTIVPRLLDLWPGPAGFWLGILLAALAVGLLGVVIEVLLLRRIYAAPQLFQLLATFGVVLIMQDVVLKVFGPQDILGPRAPGLRAPVVILGHRFPSYELVLIAAGPIVLGVLWFILQRTRFGILVRAATQDRGMVGALGVNQALLFTGTLFLGAFLAGLGGALQIPKMPATTRMDLDVIAEAFVVTVVARFVARSVTTTGAERTGAFEASVTVPTMRPVLSCASVVAGASRVSRRAPSESRCTIVPSETDCPCTSKCGQSLSKC